MWGLPLRIIVTSVLIHFSLLVQGNGLPTQQFPIRNLFQAEEGQEHLQMRTRRQYPYRPAVADTSVKEKAQNLERPPLLTALRAALAFGLSNRQATLFAEQMFVMQVVFQRNQRAFGSSVEVFAAGFKTTLNIGITQGMSKEEATQFATAMVPTYTGFGFQTVATIASFAETYSSALRIGTLKGMSEQQVIAFGENVISIQADFGKQSKATVTTFANDFIKIWDVGVGQGMGDGEVVRFAFIMLNIQARLGTMPLAQVVSYAEQFVRDFVQSGATGQSTQQGLVVAATGIINRAGVSLFSRTQPKVKVENGKRLIEENVDKGPVIEIAGIDLLGSLKV